MSVVQWPENIQGKRQLARYRHHGRLAQSWTQRSVAVLLTGVALALGGCASYDDWYEESLPKSKLIAGDAQSLNYTPHYIHSFNVKGPNGVGGGGSNIIPAYPDGRPSSGGVRCCISFPRQWQPELRVTVRWLMDKVQDGKTPGYWYKAENVQIPEYDGSQTGGAWAIFLPGDRVKLMIADGNANGRNSVDRKHSSDDPDLFQGVRDDEWNLKYRRGGLQ